MSARAATENPSPRRLRRWLLAVAVLVVLVLTGAGGWLLVRSHGAAPAAASTPPGDRIVPRDSGQAVALPSTAPTGVPAAVVTDAPGLLPAAEPVALAGTTEFGGGIRARLAEVRAVDARARIPGEVSGPALRVTVELTNTTGSPVSVDGVAVNLYTGPDGAPAAPITEQAGTPLRGSLAPGASAQGVYAFTVPADRRDLVTVTVAVGPQGGTAVFSGPLR